VGRDDYGDFWTAQALAGNHGKLVPIQYRHLGFRLGDMNNQSLIAGTAQLYWLHPQLLFTGELKPSAEWILREARGVSIGAQTIKLGTLIFGAEIVEISITPSPAKEGTWFMTELIPA
jgi:hypothetical protein